MKMSAPMIPISTSAPTANELFARPTRRNMGSKISMPQMTEAGKQFLKSTFAAPDFAGQGQFSGIPDDITALVSPFRHILTGSLWDLLYKYGDNKELDLCVSVVVMQPPTPGYAFWFCPLEAGASVLPTSIFHGVPYDDFESLFQNDPTVIPPTKDVNTQANKFRFSGNSLELICVSNAVQWRGNIRAFKLNLDYTDTTTYAPDQNVPSRTITTCITGVEGVNATSAAAFITPANLGCFMTATNTESTFPTRSIPDKIWDMNGNNVDAHGVFRGIFTGFGTLGTNVMVLENVKTTGSSPSSDNATLFQVRSWSMVEYFPQPQSLLYKTAIKSPETDVVALEVYRAVVADLPIAVTYAENDSFWKRLLGVIGKVGSFLTNLPGPIGLISGGVGTLASTIGGLID